MKQATTTIEVKTRGQGLVMVTREIVQWVADQSIQEGLLTVFIKHTSASLTIQENADPDVQTDLTNFMARLVPESFSSYIHTCEGADDMPAHIKTSLTDVQLSIPVLGGRPVLGTWQGIYVFEHRTSPHRRSVVLHLMGE